LVASANGTIEEDSDYYPYGGERAYLDTLANQTYKFTSKQRDVESGLDYFGARYYVNSLGRFLTPDWADKPTSVPYAEFGDPQSLNLYGYVRNHPVLQVDGDGHEECFTNGACNPIKNPAAASNWVINGLANTVSDLVGGDEVAQGVVDTMNAETVQGKIGTALGVGLVIGLNVFTGGEEGVVAKGAKEAVETGAKVGGRLGGVETRALDKAVAEGLEKEGYTVTHGAGKPQEYIPGPGGARKGSSYPDVTATNGEKTVRVNTVDTSRNGSLTTREQRNANKIKNARPNDEFRTVPKNKKPKGKKATDGT
jgi:RHS repeat-associated protein